MAALRARGWHYAPHTSRLTPRLANVHELEAGSDGERIFVFLFSFFFAVADTRLYRPVALLPAVELFGTCRRYCESE